MLDPAAITASENVGNMIARAFVTFTQMLSRTLNQAERVGMIVTAK
jgi:hypothetical protein